VAPTLAVLQSLPAGLNQTQRLLADIGHFSEKNVAAWSRSLSLAKPVGCRGDGG